MPQEWTEGRLDELSKKVDDGFARVDKKVDDGFARVDKKVDDGFARIDKKVDGGFERVDADLRALRLEMSTVQRTMVQGFIAITGGMFAGFAVLGGLIATQL